MSSDSVRLPRSLLLDVEAFLIRATQRLANTPGVESQLLSREGEDVLLRLASEWAMDDTRNALWPEGRPSMPAPAKANGDPVRPADRPGSTS